MSEHCRLRMLLFACAALAVLLPVPNAASSGTCSGTPTAGCGGLSTAQCGPGNVPGCSIQAPGGSCVGKTIAYKCVSDSPQSCSDFSDPSCHPASEYCTGGGDCCSPVSDYSACIDKVGNCGVATCSWSGGAYSCGGTFSGSCSDYDNLQSLCQSLGCTWTPGGGSSVCDEDACTANYPSGCCSDSPVCSLGATGSTGRCEACLAVGNRQECGSSLDCCSGTCDLDSESSTYLHCVCSDSGQGCSATSDCCPGLGLACDPSARLCEFDRPPEQPATPQIGPVSITLKDTVACTLNCPPSPLPADPDAGDSVSMSYQWDKASGGATTAYPWSSDTTFDCAANACVEGDTMHLQSRACDRFGACTASQASNVAIVVATPQPIAAGTGLNPTYVILSLVAAFSVLALAYMATYLFEMI